MITTILYILLIILDVFVVVTPNNETSKAFAIVGIIFLSSALLIKYIDWRNKYD